MKTLKLYKILLAIAPLAFSGCPAPNADQVSTPKAPIDIAAIVGVTAPVKGATPVDVISENAQYTGTVSWSPTVSGTFAASTIYTATITLTPKAGFTLEGVAANFFTVAGATDVSNNANSGIVTAVFPSTLPFSLVMVNVPAGKFQRDSTSTNISEITQPYWMSKNEITRTQFEAVMGTDPSIPSYSSGMNDPVQSVSWYQAIAFCNKLSLAEGLTPVYTVTGVNFSTLTFAEIPTTSNDNWNNATAEWNANGYRLPTEMEWMWAAMGAPTDGQNGGTNTSGYAKEFSGSTGSNTIDDYAWYAVNSANKTHSVQTKQPNELALHDMSGNVFEWCWDRYASYPPGTLIDYKGHASMIYRVKRGGSWSQNASNCSVASRDLGNAYDQHQNLGFRVVRRP